MTQPSDLGLMILDAFGRTMLLVWSSWPEWSREQPSLWAIPGAVVLSVVGKFLPRRRFRRRRR